LIVVKSDLAASILSVEVQSVVQIDDVASPNGSRYAPSGVLVGGTRQRRFDGTNLKPRKLLENAHAAKRQSHHYSPGALPGVGCTLC
jgi:hypothetical protein